VTADHSASSAINTVVPMLYSCRDNQGRSTQKL
jgi:hypothetical protein